MTLIHLRRATVFVVCGFVALCLPRAMAQAVVSADTTESTPVVADPFFLLVQDELIRQTLALTPTQRAEIDAILGERNLELLRIRDVGPQSAPPEVAPAVAAAKDAITAKLDAQQHTRLKQLVLQAQGYDALFDGEFKKVLGLSAKQLERLRAVGDEFRQQLRELAPAPSASDGSDAADSLDAAKKSRHQRVLATLTARQQQIWADRIGEPVDFSKVRPSPAMAPEFEGVERWLNSEPLTMKELQGRVVVVHFFAFGCSNCINNYPWYREWQNELPRDKVTLVGIHTPETSTEHDAKQLAAKLRESELTFPIAVDNGKRNWQNWSNGVWPSVYLVDKRGRVRYWWYGELDWQGAGGQRKMKQQIRQLMAEE